MQCLNGDSAGQFFLVHFFNIQLFYWEEPVHFIPQLLMWMSSAQIHISISRLSAWLHSLSLWLALRHTAYTCKWCWSFCESMHFNVWLAVDNDLESFWEMTEKWWHQQNISVRLPVKCNTWRNTLHFLTQCNTPKLFKFSNVSFMLYLLLTYS